MRAVTRVRGGPGQAIKAGRDKRSGRAGESNVAGCMKGSGQAGTDE